MSEAIVVEVRGWVTVVEHEYCVKYHLAIILKCVVLLLTNFGMLCCSGI